MQAGVASSARRKIVRTMPDVKGTAKLTNDERREMILAFLRDESPVKLAKKYDVARSWIYAYADRVREDPEAAIREAEAELDFRREVARLVNKEER